jgi:hypothetical protein
MAGSCARAATGSVRLIRSRALVHFRYELQPSTLEDFSALSMDRKTCCP